MDEEKKGEEKKEVQEVEPVKALTRAGGIFAAIPKIMEEMKAVEKGKDHRGMGESFKYRGINDLQNALQKIMGKHGVFLNWKKVKGIRMEVVTKK